MTRASTTAAAVSGVTSGQGSHRVDVSKFSADTGVPYECLDKHDRHAVILMFRVSNESLKGTGRNTGPRSTERSGQI